LTVFAGFERADESCDVSCLTDADARLVAVPVVSLGNDFDDDCDAVEDCTREVEISGAPLLG